MPSSISVVVPAYNEEDRLVPTLEKVAEHLAGLRGRTTEIIVVDDGSRDRTAAAARAAGEKLTREGLSVRVLENPGNRGKGYSVRHGMLEAQGDWILFTDADLSAPIEEFDKLLDAVERKGCDIAIGSRAVDRSLIGKRQPFFRELSGRIFNLAVRVVAGLPFKDTQCGFKLFSRRATKEIFARQKLDRFGFDVEILFLARKLGFETAETAVRWNDAEGTKVGVFSGADAFIDILRVRWNDLTGKYR